MDVQIMILDGLLSYVAGDADGCVGPTVALSLEKSHSNLMHAACLAVVGAGSDGFGDQ
jgi:hypothetical protein